MLTTYPVPVREERRTDYAARLGVVLREARELKGLRQEDVADLVGLVAATVHRYETGKTKVPAEMLWRFAEVLDIPEKMLVEPPSDRRLVIHVLTSPRLRDVPPELRALEDEFRRAQEPEDDPAPRRAGR